MEKYHMYLTGITITIMGVYMCNKQIALLLNYQRIHNNVFEVYKYKYFTATINNTYICIHMYWQFVIHRNPIQKTQACMWLLQGC